MPKETTRKVSRSKREKMNYIRSFLTLVGTFIT